MQSLMCVGVERAQAFTTILLFSPPPSSSLVLCVNSEKYRCENGLPGICGSICGPRSYLLLVYHLAKLSLFRERGRS